MSNHDGVEDGAISLVVATADDGKRIDQWIGERVPDLSRSAAARLIRDGQVTVDGEVVSKPSLRLEAGTTVEIVIPAAEPATVSAEEIPLTILYEDSELAVIDKPAGLVVHPAAGHPGGTLVNALLHHLDDLSGVGGELRPGIVHRLDKDTSGVLVVAKNDRAHRVLSESWGTEAVRKFYLALVYGTPDASEGSIDTPIGRHPRDRKKMAVVNGGRPSQTLYRLLASYTGCSLLELELKTGRTHQIRVHLQSIGHPVVGDPVYGGAQWKGIQDRGTRDLLRSIDRQVLHASRLELAHPVSGERMTFESPLPEEIRTVIDRLRND